METKFNERLHQLSSQKSHNARSMNREYYNEVLNRFIELQNNNVKKYSKDYKLLNRYAIAEYNLDGEKFRKLVKSGTQLRFVCDEDLFGVINKCHAESGHNGRDKLMAKLNGHYANVTQEQVATYLQLCETCQMKKLRMRKGLVTKPILSSKMNERCQVDLIDFQSEPDGSFHYILTYQDHFTKMVTLRSLRTKRAEEVADILFDIFCDRGAPTLLHSDNGREFQNKVITELVAMWPGCKTVSGKPRHSQSQGSVERQNRVVREKLACWKADTGRGDWSKGLRIVQWQINSAKQAGIRAIPYEVTYGQKPFMGLARLNLPEEIEQQIQNEEDLEEMGAELHWKYDNDAPEQDENEDVDVTGVDEDELEVQEEEVDQFEGCSSKFIDSLRVTVAQNMKQQAARMLGNSARRFPSANIGDTVLVPIPDVDRGRAEFPNVKAVVLQANENATYKLGTLNGVLKQHYTRNQFTPCKEKFVALENVPPNEISLREAANTSAMGSGQGFLKCWCKKKCTAGSCKCFKNKMKCNSKCHPNIPTCDNKNE